MCYRFDRFKALSCRNNGAVIQLPIGVFRTKSLIPKAFLIEAPNPNKNLIISFLIQNFNIHH
jgi:hypothetical protein